MIDHDCFIAPRGAYVLDVTKAVVRHSQFQGLSYGGALEHKAFVHVRPPESPLGREMMAKGGAAFSSDFLDSIASDRPREMWVLAYNAAATQVHVRNLFWDGFHAYAVLNSAEYGAAYFGLGVPNVDIAFML